jgi:hypothetical protein
MRLSWYENDDANTVVNEDEDEDEDEDGNPRTVRFLPFSSGSYPFPVTVAPWRIYFRSCTVLYYCIIY